MKHLLRLCLFPVIVLSFAASAITRTAGSNVGQSMPDLKVDYVKAKPETTGKPLIVEFWATWCGPCKQSIPHLNEIHKKYKDKGLVVVGLTDEGNPVIKTFTKQTPIEYHAATDRNGKLKKQFGVSGIPHALLVDKTGKIVWEGHPSGLNDAEIEKILQ